MRETRTWTEAWSDVCWIAGFVSKVLFAVALFTLMIVGFATAMAFLTEAMSCG